jgi:hypothetical protein
MDSYGRYPDRDEGRCPRCGSPVGARAAFCPECGTRLAPPASAAAEPRGGLPPWAVPAFIATALLALGLGAVLALLLSGSGPDGELAGGSATPTPSASATDAASGSPTESADPTPIPTATPEPTPTPPPAFANRSIVEVTVGVLNLRSQPGTGSTVIGELGEGARLFTIGQPQEVAGERWYRVAVVAGPYSRCEPQFCPRDIGYVAEGSTAAEPYLLTAELNCPSSPMTAEALDALAPLERLSCYGGNPIVVTGTVDSCYCDGPLVVEYEPWWLAAPVSQFLFHGTPALWLRFEDGEVAPEDLVPGDIVAATVSMEHESAVDCTVSGPGDDHPTKAEIILTCRAELVVDGLSVTGHDPDVGG